MRLEADILMYVSKYCELIQYFWLSCQYFYYLSEKVVKTRMMDFTIINRNNN